MKKEPTSTAVIRFQDCDPFGHLNNGKYVDYLLNAREDHVLKFHDINIYEMAQNDGVSWVVGKHELVFKMPALVMEEVTMKSRLLRFNEKSLQVEVRMYDKKEEYLKAVMWTTFVHIDMRTKRAAPQSDFLMNRLQEIHHPITAKTIDERVAELTSALAEV